MVVSHDQYFLSQAIDTFWTMRAGALRVLHDLGAAKAFSFPELFEPPA